MMLVTEMIKFNMIKHLILRSDSVLNVSKRNPSPKRRVKNTNDEKNCCVFLRLNITKIDITIIKGYGSNHRCIFFILLFYKAFLEYCFCTFILAYRAFYSRHPTSIFIVCRQDRKIKVAVYGRNETPNLRTDFFKN